MKLVHPDYAFQIEFREGIVQKLVLESPEIMSDFIVDFRKQLDGQEGKWILSHEGEILKIANSCELILNIFDLKINQRKMLNALYDKLFAEISDTELIAEWRAIQCDLEHILNRAIDATEYQIEYKELEVRAFFKAAELRFQENADGYVEYLLEYLELMSEICKIRIFVIVNATSFLTKTELGYLYEQAAYKKYQLLLVDAQNLCVNEETERTIIVDQDYCIVEIQ